MRQGRASRCSDLPVFPLVYMCRVDTLFRGKTQRLETNKSQLFPVRHMKRRKNVPEREKLQRGWKTALRTYEETLIIFMSARVVEEMWQNDLTGEVKKTTSDQNPN